MRPILLPFMIVALAVPCAFGQAGPELGDDFIFFVNGTNTQVPAFDGAVIADPDDPNNQVIEYGYGNWSFQAFRFPGHVGVDMSQNRADGDVLSLRLQVHPDNTADDLSIMLEDKTDGSNAADGTADLPFRLKWQIPMDLRDGMWHDVQIPLPPATFQELEDGKADGSITGLAMHWAYKGAWTSGTQGVGLDGLGPNTAQHPNLWQEYEWENVQNLGIFWDTNQGGSWVRVDDVYIGDPNLDLSVATDAPMALSGVSFDGSAEGNRVSWTASSDAGGYNVYVSTTAITDVAADGVALLSRATSDMTEVMHELEVPHASLAPLEVHYAVTPLSFFGVENMDVSGSSGSVANADLPVQAFITELTDAEANTLYSTLLSQDLSTVMDGYPQWLQPFVVDMNHSKQADAGLPDDDADLSAKVWAGYDTQYNGLYIYAEITDDQISLAPVATPPSDAWGNDSIEFGWGHYDVRDVGGDILTGSPHQDMMRGTHADYQFRISGHGDGTKAGTTPHAFVGWSINTTPPGAAAAYDVMADGTGYKLFAHFPTDGIQNVDEGDAVVDLPTNQELWLIPFNIALNDGDGGPRDAQIQWSIKGNAGGQWWNTPAQWMTVALAGRGTATGTSSGTELPEAIVLEQNYPNPFNPSTAIRFALPEAERVTLRVYDALGRTVVTLLDQQTRRAGTHTVRFDGHGLSSGVYLYRLEVGEAYVQSRTMLLIK